MKKEEDIDKRLNDLIRQKKEEIARLVRLMESIDMKSNSLPKQDQDESDENPKTNEDEK